MSEHVVETVVFKLLPKCREEEFVDAAKNMQPFIESLEGFIHRRLSHTTDGTWVEHIEWETLQAAQEAARKIGVSVLAERFIACIDGQSVSMYHGNVAVSVN